MKIQYIMLPTFFVGATSCEAIERDLLDYEENVAKNMIIVAIRKDDQTRFGFCRKEDKQDIIFDTEKEAKENSKYINNGNVYPYTIINRKE